jgi:hypothetical protein
MELCRSVGKPGVSVVPSLYTIAHVRYISVAEGAAIVT